MFKLLKNAFLFSGGAILGMLFSTKDGSNIRKKMKQKKSNEDKAEIVAEEAKAMATNFWNTIKGPLKKAGEAVRKDIEKYGNEYGKEAKSKIDGWKKQATKEIEKDIKKAKSEIKKATKKAKSRTKKKVSAVKKTVTKKLKK
ncbi:MAG: hypothetical protein P1V18_06085 [Candidatus Gracilibacteria bacterium]|nr:hypothetical protein [Candidatus Gracilibacteria bacterium]